jgi:hypothetical protein
MDALREALRADPPAGCGALSGDDLANLAAAIEAARTRQREELHAAIDAAYGQLPRLLRGPLRKVLGG